MTLGGSSHDLDVYSVAQRLCVAVVPSTVARMGVHIVFSRRNKSKTGCDVHTLSVEFQIQDAELFVFAPGV